MYSVPIPDSTASTKCPSAANRSSTKPSWRNLNLVDEHPTVPLAEAAARLNISDRQARRLAPQLGGRMIAGRWFVDELALRQHIEGRKA